MINSIVHGAFNDDGNGSMTGSGLEPPSLNLLSDEQFPGLGGPEALSQSESNLAPSMSPRSFKPTMNSMPNQSVEGASALVTPAPSAELSPEELRRLSDLTRKMFGADAGVETKYTINGQPLRTDVLHPLSPLFNVELCRNQRRRYDCPFVGCRYATCICDGIWQLEADFYSSDFQYEQHLQDHCRSDVHEKREITCPKCMKRFQSTSAFVAHLESATVRCNIQRSAYYNDALAIASGGFLVHAGYNEDGSVMLKEDEPSW